jgi:hypothetical protein
MANVTEGIQGLTITLLTRCLKWAVTEVELFLMDVRKDVRNKKIHSYYHLYVGLEQKNRIGWKGRMLTLNF